MGITKKEYKNLSNEINKFLDEEDEEKYKNKRPNGNIGEVKENTEKSSRDKVVEYKISEVMSGKEERL